MLISVRSIRKEFVQHLQQLHILESRGLSKARQLVVWMIGSQYPLAHRMHIGEVKDEGMVSRREERLSRYHWARSMGKVVWVLVKTRNGGEGEKNGKYAETSSEDLKCWAGRKGWEGGPIGMIASIDCCIYLDNWEWCIVHVFGTIWQTLGYEKA